jgi:hypothetical protein
MSDRYLYVPSLGVVLGALLAFPAAGLAWPTWPATRRTWLAVSIAILLLIVPQPRIHQFTHPALLWAAEAARPDPAASILAHLARTEETAGHLRPARDASLRAARRYAELGFAEGLAFALSAARLETFASGERGGAMQAYATALGCLRSGQPDSVAVPFSDGGGVRIPCQTPEAEIMRTTRSAMLDAEIDRVQRRLRENGTAPLPPPR